MSPRSQAARGKEKEKDGTTDSGIKLEPVPGLPGGECRLSVYQVDGCLQIDCLDVPRLEETQASGSCSSSVLPAGPPGFNGGGNSVAQLSSPIKVGYFLFSSSSSSSCSRGRSLCQLLQPPPKWSSSCGEHCPAAAPWYRPTPTPR